MMEAEEGNYKENAKMMLTKAEGEKEREMGRKGEREEKASRKVQEMGEETE